MVTQCPKCQTEQTLQANQIDDGSKIVCPDCHAHLKVKVLLEIDDSQTSYFKADENTQQHKNTALVCIDGEATREVLKTLLEDAGFHMLDIPSGISSFMSMKLDAPKIALVDAGFTDMSGTELVSQIKNNAHLAKTPVILVSSMFEKNTKYREEDPELYGADDFIDRDQIPQNLMAKIERLLQGKEPILETFSEEDAFGAPIEEDEQMISDEASPEEIQEARDLAEKIVSDISLFNHRKIEEGLQNDTLFELLGDEIKEGKQFFESKTNKTLWNAGYLEEALENLIAKKTSEHESLQPAALPDSEKPTELFEKPIFNANDSPKILAPELPEADEEKSEEAVSDEPSKEEKDAQRLARLIISDIAIYNPEKVAEGIEKGSFHEILEDELKEGRELFQSRVDTELFGFSIYEEALATFIRSKSNLTNKSENESAVEPVPEKEAHAEPAGSDEISYEDDLSAEEDEDPILEQSDEALEDAIKIAKDIISNIIFQNEDKLTQDIDSDSIYDVLGDEIMEGRQQFELKAPAYFDTSLYEDEIDRIFAARAEKAQQLEQAHDMSISKPEIPKASAQEENWDDPVLPEAENADDVFKAMEQEAEAVAEEVEVSETDVQEESWDDPVLPEAENADDVFKAMEQEAEAVAEKVEPPLETPPATSEKNMKEESDEVKSAKRLAKIIVSDIVIYNEDKVEEGLKNETFYEVLADEIKEGQDLFETRVSKEILNDGLYEAALENYINSKKETLGSGVTKEVPESEDAPQMPEAEDFSAEIENTPSASVQSKPVLENGNAHSNGNGNGNGNGRPHKNGAGEESKAEKEAKRLAKIIVSDIVIYNEKKVDEGIQSGTFYDVLEEEIKEGQSLYESRVSQEILKTKDYLNEAFEAFIKQRAATPS